MIRLLLIALVLAAPPLRAEEPVSAESPESIERPIYESIDGVVIGRVFLSSEDRTRLDAMRRTAPEPPGPRAAAAAAPATGDSAATGYIRVGDKAPAVFRDGRFVRGDERLPTAKAPGVIRRHDASESRESAGER